MNTKSFTLKDNEKDGFYTVIEDEVVIKEIPQRTNASSCCEVLTQIKSLSDLVNDVDTLDALEDQLKVSLELLKNEAPEEKGVIVQPVNVTRNIKE